MDNGESSYRRFLSGDDSGMVELVRDYKDGLMLYLNHYTDSIYQAEDLVQTTFMRLAVKKPRYNGKSSFKTWLFSIGRHVAVDCIRKSGREINVTENEYSESESYTDIEREYFKKENSTALYEAMRTIKGEYAQVLYLTYFENFSNDEISKIMKKSKRQIENLKHNAKKALRSELERCGFEYEEL